MCNLYRLSNSAAEVARLFYVSGEQGSNAGGEIYPGYPGMVIAGGALQTMVWGFPMAQTSKRTGEPLKPCPVNNTRTDKLDSFFWRYSFEERRCLIPLDAWAEAEGAKGAKTRTWMSLPGSETFAVAGIWRESDEWGRCYSMVMTDAGGEASQVHDRMPVILQADQYETWQHAPPGEAKALCTGFRGALSIARTVEAWSRR